MALHQPLKLTSRLLLLSTLLAFAEPTGRVHADSTIAHCQLSHHNPSIPLQSGPCRFSQRQGNVTIMFREQTFNFPYSEAGQSYQRSNSTTGIRFDMSGGATIEVLWR